VTTREGKLDVPGASLFYRIQGTGPWLLFIQGGDGTADGGAVVDALATAYTVITYDPRGLSRSTVQEPPRDLQLETHGDDAHHLLSALTGEPVLAFGFSRGALVGLDLASRYGAQVRVLVAHEPPLTQLLSEMERTEAAAFQQAMETVYARQGPLAAMQHFGRQLKIDFTDREPGAELSPVPPGRAANLDFFLTHDAPAVRTYRLDMDALRAAPTRIIPAAGAASGEVFPRRCALSLAAELGEPLAEFPGGHAGPTTHPRAFAARLAEVLDAAIASETEHGET
jgi:pimeloyl-ACP methyl ester carboxylesterase